MHILCGNTASQPIKIKLHVNDRPLEMEVDTGATVSIISETMQQEMFPQAKLCKSEILLKTYTGEPLKTKGVIEAKVRYGKQDESLRLTVVEGEGPSLFGRDWLKHIRLDWKQIGATTAGHSTAHRAEQLCEQYSDVFKDDLGTIHPAKACLSIDQNARPRLGQSPTVLATLSRRNSIDWRKKEP